jgi:hypothetical protein
MPEVARYNKVIDLLEQGKTVFASGLVWNGNLDDLTFIADSDYDMVMIEMEHEGFSFDNLRVSLQFLLNRKRVCSPTWCHLFGYPQTLANAISGLSSKLWTLACTGWCCRI